MSIQCVPRTYDKLPDCVIRGIWFRGVLVESRYHKLHEYRAMLRMVSAIHPSYVTMVDRIFCDSKAQHSYTVELAGDYLELAHLICDPMTVVLHDAFGGCNWLAASYQNDFVEVACGDWDPL